MKTSVQESVQEKKATFDRFKRQGFTPAPTEMKPPVSEQEPAVMRSAVQSGTIDLKQMMKPESAPTITQNHVINLRQQK